MLKRLFDLIASFIGLILLIPFFLVISLFIVFDSKGGVFYRQIRVGRGGRLFNLFKFRTMMPDADSKGLLTVGGRDSRITRSGLFLRKYKIDELPQLINVFFGHMSIVGPRPEVPKYVDLYSPDQRKVLEVRPGLTDPASLTFINENELLAASSEPEKTYIEEIMPLKLALSIDYVQNKSLLTDLKIIFKTLKGILKS